ncbi:MAG: carbonate dehydratase [Patescibacteria group bacterium]
MKNLSHLFKQNKTWAAQILKKNPEFFKVLSEQQSPEYLWIGCSDSRVPANEIVNLLPGELFVHRNVANLVKYTDMNCLSVLQYAIDILKVKHIIVCGHYGCGGVRAAMEDKPHGLVDNWIGSILDIYSQNKKIFSKLKSEESKVNKLCELNVKSQVYNVSQTTIVQEAWKRKQNLTIHGWIYSLKDGLLKDLEVSISNGKKF